MVSITRRWWIVLGAVAGALLLGLAGALASTLFPELRHVTPWGPYWSVFWGLAACMVGLVIGGFIGSHAVGMPRRSRIAFGAAVGASIGAALGGSLFLWAEVTGEDWPSGMAAFVMGAVCGGSAGATAGGLLGARRTTRPSVKAA